VERAAMSEPQLPYRPGSIKHAVARMLLAGEDEREIARQLRCKVKTVQNVKCDLRRLGLLGGEAPSPTRESPESSPAREARSSERPRGEGGAPLGEIVEKVRGLDRAVADLSARLEWLAGRLRDLEQDIGRAVRTELEEALKPLFEGRLERAGWRRRPQARQGA